MTRMAASVIEYWTAGGWVCLPIAGVSFGIWFFYLRSRRLLRAALSWDGAELDAAGWDRSTRRLEESLTRDFVILAAWTAAAPLLGLAGTVAGMIRTFTAVAHLSGDTGVQVAGGISQALITTQAGLAVAIPGLFGLARLQRLTSQFRVHIAAARIERFAFRRPAENRT